MNEFKGMLKLDATISICRRKYHPVNLIELEAMVTVEIK